MTPRSIRFVLWPLGAAAVWMLAASALWSGGTGTPFTPIAWYVATQWWRANWWVNLWLVLSAVIATLLLAMLSFGLLQYRRLRLRSQAPLSGPSPRRDAPRPSERGRTDNHGHAQWRSAAATQKLFPGPHPKWGGLAVGEAYRVDFDRSIAGTAFDPYDKTTWGKGGKAPLLIDPCTEGSGHSLVFAGSGAFKTQSAVSSILTWTGSSVVLDPSTELGPMLDGALKSRGKRVAHLGIAQAADPRVAEWFNIVFGVPWYDPWVAEWFNIVFGVCWRHPEALPLTGFDVLSWIDISHPEAELHVRSVVSWIYDETSAARAGKPEDPFFAPMGRSLVTCILAHLLWFEPKPVPITLETFAGAFAVSEKEMLSLLADIRTASKSPLARQLAGTMMQCQAEETFSGIFLNAVKGIEWLFTRAYAKMVSEGDFDPRSLLREPTTVFLNISLRTLETTPAIPRVMVGALLNTLYMADGRTNGKVLFLLDEAAQLGRLKTLETARDTGRKYGIVLHALWQSIGQMTEIWGREGTRAWIDAAHWIGYAAVRAGGAGKDLSNQLGGHGVLAWSEGDNQGSQRPFGISFGTVSRGSNLNVHEIRRSLITAAELQQDLRDDEFIVVPSSGLPIRCGRALWFRREKMKALIATNRFAKGATHGGPSLKGKAPPPRGPRAPARTGRRLLAAPDHPR